MKVANWFLDDTLFKKGLRLTYFCCPALQQSSMQVNCLEHHGRVLLCMRP